MKGFEGFGDSTSPITKKGDPKNKTLAYDTDPKLNAMRSDTVKTFIHQKHFKKDKKKYPVTHKIGKDAQKRLKGHKVTQAEVDRQHNTKTFKAFEKANPRKKL